MAFREAKAVELLFQDCLKRFHVTSTRNAVMHMFGANTIITPSKTNSSVKSSTLQSASTSTKKVTQTMMSSFLLDSFLVDTIKKKERAKKKTEEATKLS